MENLNRQIFEQLGNLFYALAADQQVSLMESGELKMLLNKDWLTDPNHLSQDKVSEASHLIGLTIDSLQNEKASGNEAFKRFFEFYSKNHEVFSEALKEKILETAEAVVKIFPSEKEKNIHLLQLKSLLEKAKYSREIGS